MARKKKTNKVNKKIFKSPCGSLDSIIEIKRLLPNEALALYTELKTIVSSLAGPHALTAYASILAAKVLVDPSILIEIEKADKDIFPTVLREIYDLITDLYLPFRIEYICSEINNDTRGTKGPIDTKTIFNESLNGGVPDNSLLTDRFPTDSEIADDWAWFDKVINDSIASDPAVGRVTKSNAKTNAIPVPVSIKEIKKIENKLKYHVIGQDDAIEKLINRVKLISVGFHKRGSFFFIGKTGCGKTLLAQQFGKLFYGNFEKINCAEFSSGHEVAKLIGAPPGYMGSSAKSFFLEKAEKSNRWVFLFDEIEKGHEKLFNLLLSLLDDGTITDSMGSKLDFTRSIFLFTSNQGISELKKDSLAFNQKATEEGDKEQLKASLDRLLTPEFRNRIDEFIYFNDLSRENAKQIAELHLREFPIIVSDALLEYIVHNAYSVDYGARNIKRFMIDNVVMPLADYILNNPAPAETGTYYEFTVKNNKVEVAGVKGEIFNP